MWIAVAIVSLAVILTLVLCVPLDLSLHADVYGRPKFRLRLSWLFGLFHKEVSRKKKPEEKKAVEEKRKAGKGRPRVRTIFALMRTRGLMKQIAGLLVGILRRFKFKNVEADFKVGLGDPADTGLLFAVIGPAVPFISSSRRRIRLVPSFEDDVILAGYSSGTVRLRPIGLVAPVMKFVFSMPALRAASKMILAKLRR